jgi:hypothetical protein
MGTSRLPTLLGREGETPPMPYAIYKLIHLVGIFALLVALAGMSAHAAAGHGKDENPSYRTLLLLHGVGALLALTGGFGLLARIGTGTGSMLPGWIWAKLVLWVLLGGLVAVPYRNRAFARALLVILPLLGLLGAALANYKPL